MKTAKISKKDAIWAYPRVSKELQKQFVELFGENFHLVKKPEELTTLEDILHYHGIDRSFLPYQQPQNKEELALNATAWLFKISEAYNGDWEANWSDTSQYKWYLYRYRNSVGSWSVDCFYNFNYHGSPSGLYYKSKELAVLAEKTFPQIYKDYWMI